MTESIYSKKIKDSYKLEGIIINNISKNFTPEKYNIFKENINLYLDSEYNMFSKDYLNLFTNEDKSLDKYFNIVIEKNKKAYYKYLIILNVGSTTNLELLFNKIKLIEKILHNNGVLTFISINNDVILSNSHLKFLENINSDNIIIKTINKGQDIGSFYLSLYYLIKNNINYEYLFRFHTKSNTQWLKNLMGFVKSEEIFKNTMDDILRNNILFYDLNKKKYDYRNILCLEKILDNYKPNLTEKLLSGKNKIFFNAGTIFIAKKPIIDLLLKLLPLENYVFFNNNYSSNFSIYEQSIVHTIERLIGFCNFILTNRD